MPVNVLKRPIHPEAGNASMVMAARLGLLFSLGTTNGQPWTTDYSAKTIIQGEILEIPWKTKAEKLTNQPDEFLSPHGKANTPVGNETADDANQNVSTEGDNISLTSELTDPSEKNSLLILTMIVYQRPPNVPTLVPGAKESYPVDVGDTLHTFDLERAQHGAEFALRGLFAKPCAAFQIPLDTVMQHIKDSVIPPAEVEARLEALPGVIS